MPNMEWFEFEIGLFGLGYMVIGSIPVRKDFDIKPIYTSFAYHEIDNPHSIQLNTYPWPPCSIKLLMTVPLWFYLFFVHFCTYYYICDTDNS